MMRAVLVIALGLLAAFGGCAAPRDNPAVTEGLPYCFVEEQADKYVFEQVGRPTLVIPTSVLLFPVVEKGVISGRAVEDAIGSPLLYHPGEPVEALQFKHIDRWPVKRYMVWARGYYMTCVPRMFLYADKVWGRDCFLVELTPYFPGTDAGKLENTIISELRKGSIIVDQDIEITKQAEPERLFRASQLTSWLKMPRTGHQKTKTSWGAPGSKVEFLLTDDDFKLIEAYLRGAGEHPPAAIGANPKK